MSMENPPVQIPKTTSHPPRQNFGLVVMVSVLVGALSGGVVGGVIAKGGLAGILKSGPKASSTSTSTVTTLTVNEESATVEVVKKVSPAVVSIVAKQDYSKLYGSQDSLPNDFFFGFPFLQQPAPQGKQEIGGGTGFIVTSDGIILTNKHVATIAGADQFTVVTNDGKSYDAKVLATDPSTDIAFMKIEGQDFPTVELGNSDSVKLGDSVVAIGNVLGKYRNTVTKGIISGLARTIEAGDGAGTSETLHDVFQTDAAINHGNSGGPLLNLSGQAIGINTAVDSQGQLVGFALPINIAVRDLESVKTTGKIERPYLGVRYVIINEQVKQEHNLSVDNGALIIRGERRGEDAVIKDGPAAKAGLAENDVILEIDGKQINQEYDLAQALIDKSVGQTITLKVWSGGKEKTVQVKLEARS